MVEVTNPRQLTDFLKSLRAVREFTQKAIPADVVHDFLEVARWSGSASNRQFAEIVTVSKRESLTALSRLAGYAGHLRGAALDMILGLPGKRVVRTAISMGNPAHAPRRGRRKPLSDLVHEERYPT